MMLHAYGIWWVLAGALQDVTVGSASRDFQVAILILTSIGTVTAAVLAWLFRRIVSRPQHDEIVRIIRTAHESFIDEMRATHLYEREAFQKERGDLRQRIDVLTERLNRAEDANRELWQRLTEQLRENGQLKAEVARLKVEVEFLRGRDAADARR